MVRKYLGLALAAALAVAGVVAFLAGAQASPDVWKYEWPKTDFEKHSIDYEEIFSGGPPKDGIPSIDDPKFIPLAEVEDLPATEPVVGLTINGDARAYPLRVLIWHEIVNDEVGGVPVSVTFCPLCNAAVVFDRRVAGKVLDFGTTGKLRHSDLIMYDRQTESWWQQFTGEAIVGAMLGARLKFLPARLESFAKFKARAPQGRVLTPRQAGRRQYGANPYSGYDSSETPFLYRGRMPVGIAPLSRVVSVEGRAWSLEFLRRKARIETDDGLVLNWEPGQNSALDRRIIAESFDVGNVTVQRKSAAGLEDVVYGVDFAFAFHAFHPDAEIVTK